jgi:hypothetical protein
MLATIESRTSFSSRPLSKIINIEIYKTIILLVVSYRRETWFLILREGHRLKVQGLKRTFGPNRGKVTGIWRKLHND